MSRWDPPRVLLQVVPESAPCLAELAVDAYDISDDVPIRPAPQQDRPLLTVVPAERAKRLWPHATTTLRGTLKTLWPDELPDDARGD